MSFMLEEKASEDNLHLQPVIQPISVLVHGHETGIVSLLVERPEPYQGHH